MIRDRVAKGCALLDAKRPGWADQIELSDLEMSDCHECVLGQLFDGFGEGADELGIYGFEDRYGFDTDSTDMELAWPRDQFAVLNELWRAEILARQAKTKEQS